ncbi:MAG: entericidin A/B family lipoprotein [Pseudomonadota bacterium]
MQIKAFLAILLTAPFLLAACNTVEGVGEDMSDVGDAISDAAQ